MNATRKFLLLVGDTLIFSISAMLMLGVRFGLPIKAEIINSHMWPFICLYILWSIVLYIFNLYDFALAKPSTESIRNLVISLAVSLIAGFLLFYLVPFPVSPKTNLIVLVVLYGILLVLWRRLYFSIFANNFKRHIAIIGETSETALLIKEIEKNPHLGYVIDGVYESVEVGISKNKKADIFVYGKPLAGNDLKLIAESEYSVLDIRLAFQNILHRIPVSLMDDTMALKIIEKREGSTYKILSIVISYFFALIILIVSLPFTLISGILIFIEDKGPIFYKQDRVGFQGKTFKIYKLRSMRVDAENAGAKWADKKDPRVTRIGKIVRSLHIDEIPQMINILRGDITLVGPRPERPEFVGELTNKIPYYFLRHTISPGFTGWAQIKFRYARTVMDSSEKFEYDLYYVKNRNFFLDFGIILKTVQIIFTH